MSKIEELKKIYEQAILPEDIILCAFARLEQTVVIKDPMKIHKIFSELKEKDEFKDIFSEFKFKGIVPYSEELDAALTGLECSGLLQTFNPSYEQYSIKVDAQVISKVKRIIEKDEQVSKGIDVICTKLKEELIN